MARTWDKAYKIHKLYRQSRPEIKRMEKTEQSQTISQLMGQALDERAMRRRSNKKAEAYAKKQLKNYLG